MDPLNAQWAKSDKSCPGHELILTRIPSPRPHSDLFFLLRIHTVIATPPKATANTGSETFIIIYEYSQLGRSTLCQDDASHYT